MKKKSIKSLCLQKISIASLDTINIIKGGESAAGNGCETNTNSTSFFCVPKTSDCKSHVLKTCPPDLESRNGCAPPLNTI